MSRGSRTTSGAIAGMFWRFLVADDASVERFIVRDSDSRLNAREAHAVAEWMKSGKKVHTIRDHPNHDRPLNGGLWGGVRGCIPRGARRGGAQVLEQAGLRRRPSTLNEVVWPRVKHDQTRARRLHVPQVPQFGKPFLDEAPGQLPARLLDAEVVGRERRTLAAGPQGGRKGARVSSARKCFSFPYGTLATWVSFSAVFPIVCTTPPVPYQLCPTAKQIRARTVTDPRAPR